MSKRFYQTNPLIFGILAVMLLTGLLCWVVPAKAMDNIDRIRTLDVSIYCQSEAKAFRDGFGDRMLGTKREIKHIDREEVERRHAAGENAPLDASYYIGWNKYTEQEREFITKHWDAGWDSANVFLTTTNQSPQVVSLLLQNYYEKCAYDEAKRRTDRSKMKNSDNWNYMRSELANELGRDLAEIHSMIHAASSDRIAVPYAPGSPQQQHCSEIATAKYNSCMIGK